MAKKSIGDRFRLSAVIVALLATAVSITLVLIIRPTLNEAVEEARRGAKSAALPTNSITDLEAAPMSDGAEGDQSDIDTGRKAAPATLEYLDLEVFDPAFFETSLFRQWEEDGVTKADLASALRLMKKQGLSGDELVDPNLIAQFLPYRDIEPAYIDRIELPDQAAAGEEVKFMVSANFPDPSYQFEKWDVYSDQKVVTVRMVGSKSGEPAPAIIIPIDLEGELPALEQGTYSIRFVAIGVPIEKTLTVE